MALTAHPTNSSVYNIYSKLTFGCLLLSDFKRELIKHFHKTNHCTAASLRMTLDCMVSVAEKKTVIGSQIVKIYAA